MAAAVAPFLRCFVVVLFFCTTVSLDLIRTARGSYEK